MPRSQIIARRRLWVFVIFLLNSVYIPSPHLLFPNWEVWKFQFLQGPLKAGCKRETFPTDFTSKKMFLQFGFKDFLYVYCFIYKSEKLWAGSKGSIFSKSILLLLLGLIFLQMWGNGFCFADLWVDSVLTLSQLLPVRQSQCWSILSGVPQGSVLGLLFDLLLLWG